jgi:hypothetical protein
MIEGKHEIGTDVSATPPVFFSETTRIPREV